MGIFDDAIRQHLDLKRRQGADESELKQLEDEAFGPPARPGDPDFPETGESQANGDAAAEAPADAEPAEASAEPEPVAEPADEAPPHGDALLADPDAKPEPPPADEGPVEDAGAAGFTTTEREAIAEQPTEFFDQPPEPLDLGELDLDLKDELEDVGTLDDEPSTGETAVEEPTPVDEAPVVEEHVEEPTPVDELGARRGARSQSRSRSRSDDEDGEDVLEETPEFLRDNPDDDELWFEQGEPKDFDF